MRATLDTRSLARLRRIEGLAAAVARLAGLPEGAADDGRGFARAVRLVQEADASGGDRDEDGEPVRLRATRMPSDLACRQARQARIFPRLAAAVERDARRAPAPAMMHVAAREALRKTIATRTGTLLALAEEAGVVLDVLGGPAAVDAVLDAAWRRARERLANGLPGRVERNREAERAPRIRLTMDAGDATGARRLVRHAGTPLGRVEVVVDGITRAMLRRTGEAPGLRPARRAADPDRERIAAVVARAAPLYAARLVEGSGDAPFRAAILLPARPMAWVALRSGAIAPVGLGDATDPHAAIAAAVEGLGEDDVLAEARAMVKGSVRDTPFGPADWDVLASAIGRDALGPEPPPAMLRRIGRALTRATDHALAVATWRLEAHLDPAAKKNSSKTVVLPIQKLSRVMPNTPYMVLIQ